MLAAEPESSSSYSESDTDTLQQQETVVQVSQPTTVQENGKKLYSKYLITLKTTSQVFNKTGSTVWRRFSEFVQLHSILESHNPHKKLPKLPTRGLFQNRFDSDFIERRASSLQNYIMELISRNFLLSETVLHLFLQSQLSMDEIAKAMSLHLCPADVLEHGLVLEPMSEAQDKID